MSLLFAAIGATLTALAEVTVVPYLAVGDAKPHLVLVIGVIWTIAAGIDRGVVWAFVGGLFLDALTGRPLGASAFSSPSRSAPLGSSCSPWVGCAPCAGRSGPI
jgi:rod shape-determining protein MreD